MKPEPGTKIRLTKHPWLVYQPLTIYGETPLTETTGEVIEWPSGWPEISDYGKENNMVCVKMGGKTFTLLPNEYEVIL